MTKVKNVECEVCNIRKAKKVGRATWLCADCGRDLSLEFVLLADALHPEWHNDGEEDWNEATQ